MMSPKKAARVVAAYVRGEKLTTIRARFNVYGGSVYRALREAGIRRRRQFRSCAAKAARVHLAYAGRPSIDEVAKRLRMPKSFVRRQIRVAKEGLARARQLETEKRRAFEEDHARLTRENESLRTELDRLRETIPSNNRMG